MSAIYDVPSVYATIGAALAAIPSNLSGQGEQEIVIEAGYYSEVVDITGFSNESSNDHIIVRAADGDESPGVLGGGVIVGSSVFNGDAFKVRSHWAEIKNIEVDYNATVQRGFRQTSAHNVTFLGCRANGGTGITADGFLISGNAKAINCISKSGTSSNAYGFNAFNSNITFTCYNCIAYDCKRRGFREDQYATMVCYNCVAINTTSGSDFDAAVTGNNNCSTDGSAPGVDSIINQTLASMNFVSYGVDFHIDTDSILWNVGIDQSAVFTEDVDGNPMGDIFPMGIHQPLASPFGGGGVGGGQLSLGLFLKL